MSDKNLLDPKSQALFTAAYGGTLDVRVVFSEQLAAHYLEVEVPDYARYEPIITLDNLVTCVADGSTPVKGSGGFTYVIGEAGKRDSADGSARHVAWCGIETGGVFRKNADGTWRVEPDRPPPWWNDADWPDKIADVTQSARRKIDDLLAKAA